MAHAPETGAINELHFLHGAGFRRRFFVLNTSGMKLSVGKNLKKKRG